ncbi:hypothetical protein [Caudoviricetes sp.]|nr:hypothetical protein [Caudoviricetes sp.]UOF79157.1 hypothetical protein [Caudoviricetes sp.]
MADIPGPLNFDVKSSIAHRAMFAGLPVGMDTILDWNIIFDDFIEVVNDQTNKWTTIIDTGCTVVNLADTNYGILTFTCDSGDNEGGSIQKNETVKFVAGKKLVFEARVAMADADDGDIAVGLAENHGTNPEAMILGAGIWFQVNEGSTSILAKSGTAGANSENTGSVMSDGAFVRLGFVYDGVNTVTFYVDRIAKCSMVFAALPTTELTPSMYYINGAADTDTASLDYIFVAQER